MAGQTTTTQYSPNHIKSIIKGIGLSISGETGNDFLCLCPFHSNRHTPSFSVSRSTGKFICFNPSCGEAGTLLDLIKRVMHKNDFESLRFIGKMEADLLNNFDDELKDILEEKPDFVEFPQETLDELHANLVEHDINASQAYLINIRGINKESMEHFGLGYSVKNAMVITPIHSPDGMPVGLVGRSTEGKYFKNSTNLPRSKTLFNIHRAKRVGDHVIIVESNFDAIRIHQAGFPNVVATLGGSLSPEQAALLNRYFNHITIMTDSDKAGRDLGYSIANKLRNKDILWASYEYGKIYPHDAKDAGDMTDSEIATCIKNAVSDLDYRSW